MGALERRLSGLPVYRNVESGQEEKEAGDAQKENRLGYISVLLRPQFSNSEGKFSGLFKEQ